MDDDAREQWRRLAWRAAATLGVSATMPGDVQTVVDPESLMVIATLVDDRRLKGELLDWCILHAPLLMPSRARRIATEAGGADDVESWISTIASRSPSVNWRSRHDPIDGFAASGKSRPYDPTLPASAALRARALGGATARTELLRALHPIAHRNGPAMERTELVRRAAVARGQVHVALDELELAGMLVRTGTERRQSIAPATTPSPDLAGAYWDSWQTLSFGSWRDAPRFARMLIDVDREPPAERPRAWAVEVVRAAHPAIGRLPNGAPLEVHATARVRARAATSKLVAALVIGTKSIPPRT
jgi:hypothetical protein